MKTPIFWKNNNALSALLFPLSLIYDAASKLHRACVIPLTLPIPVICIGNVTAGGAGKTPVALHVGQKLKQKNLRAFFLSRGYGGNLLGPLLVDPARHTAGEVGDEPLLLARLLPTVVAGDRRAGARLAIEHGAQVIIMDDGLQNPSLAKTLSLLVVDGQSSFGNGHILPAGPLRESIAESIRRADAVIIMGSGEMIPFGKPLLRAIIQPSTDFGLKGKTLLAFCGIATPQKFFTMLETLGATLAETIAFADHHAYTPPDLQTLADKAARHNATLVTTTKDAVRLPETFAKQVRVVDIALAFENEAMLDRLLDDALNAYGKA